MISAHLPNFFILQQKNKFLKKFDFSLPLQRFEPGLVTSEQKTRYKKLIIVLIINKLIIYITELSYDYY